MLKSIVFDACLYLSLMKIWLSLIAEKHITPKSTAFLILCLLVWLLVHLPVHQPVSKLVCFPARMFIISFLPLSPSWCGRLSLQSIYNASNFTLSLSEHALNYIAGKCTHFHKHTQNMTGIENRKFQHLPIKPTPRGTWSDISMQDVNSKSTGQDFPNVKRMLHIVLVTKATARVS